MPMEIGTEFDVTIGKPAAGGGFVGRSPDGIVTFVRHALPGERVRVRVTETSSKFLRADAVAILEASPDRVEPACALAGPGGCGGCDYQHASLVAQRRFKGQLIAEQLERLAGITMAVTVEPAVKGDTGLGWRTAVRFSIDEEGRTCLHAHRSSELIPVEHCPIATDQIHATGVTTHRYPGMEAVSCFGHPDADTALVAFETGPTGFLQTPEVTGAGLSVDGELLTPPARAKVTVGPNRFDVSSESFFQVHRAAARALTAAVMDAARVQPGEQVADLYSGVGLFTVPLALAVGSDGVVISIERSTEATADARRNVRHLSQVQIVTAPVTARTVADLLPGTDVIVMDPARDGAAKGVVDALCSLAPGARRMVFVSCDPATFARDVARAQDQGWHLASLRALDLFPQTEHVEMVGVLER